MRYTPPMEPDRQVEIQLGHMCNNRCVFCVSGQRTAMREAFPLPEAPILAKLDEARAKGHEKLTLLGGEPTLQPTFFKVLQHAVSLGFSEIVIFTNGVKTANAEFVDRILATGGPFHFRISIQGATREAHELTTRKHGSFLRILRTLENLHAREQRISINMCVVRSNYESVDAFPELCTRFGVEQLHLDMMRPLDAGDRTEEELKNSMPDYTEMVPALTRMIQGFRTLAPAFDVNIGNLPYCVAPELLPYIHHDGESTATIAIDGDDTLSEPWDKYLVKRRDKLEHEGCTSCLLSSRCSGFFETYARFYGMGALAPLTPTRMLDDALAASRQALAQEGVTLLAPGEMPAPGQVARSIAIRLERLTAAAPFGELRWEGTTLEQGGSLARLIFLAPSGERAQVWLSQDGRRAKSGYEVGSAPSTEIVAGLRELMQALTPPEARVSSV